MTNQSLDILQKAPNLGAIRGCKTNKNKKIKGEEGKEEERRRKVMILYELP